MQIMKKISKIHFYILVLTFSSSICFLYYLTINNNSSFENIHYSKSSNLEPKQISIWTNKFEQILNEECNVVNVKPTMKCLNSLKNLDYQRKKAKYKSRCNECVMNNNSFIIYHHTFWQIDEGSLNINDIRILKLNIMSYLFTQNLCCTKFILWKLDNFPVEFENEIKIMFDHYIKLAIIQIKTFDLKNICRMYKSIFIDSLVCELNILNDIISHNYVGLSDFVRFVVLDILPGIYTDGDVIYLKDMSLLWFYNFAYRWSFTNDYNTAIMGLNKDMNNSIKSLYSYIINECNSIEKCISLFHPISITDILNKLNKKTALVKMNSLLFDPSWLCNDGLIKKFYPTQVCKFLEFNEKVLVNVTHFEPSVYFYNGPFTYHMHLAGGRAKKIVNHSYFDYFEKFYYRILSSNQIKIY